jgi:uncharacterized membrane protein YeaQ/YmgE (transglycosylase-associated protein family)
MNDKLLHVLASLSIAIIVGFLLSPATGFFGAIVVGAAKEAWDALGHGTASWSDMAANVVGAVVGVVVVQMLL